MTDITREEFPREFPIFPKETTTPRLTEIEPDQETVVPEMQETSSKVKNVPSVIYGNTSCADTKLERFLAKDQLLSYQIIEF